MVGTTTVYQTQIRILAVSDFTRPITPDSRDFAFETIIDPTSMISSFSALNGTLAITVSHTYSNYVYRMMYSTKLLNPVWEQYSSKKGIGSALEWTLPVPLTDTMFFKVVAEEIE